MHSVASDFSGVRLLVDSLALWGLPGQGWIDWAMQSRVLYATLLQSLICCQGDSRRPADRIALFSTIPRALTQATPTICTNDHFHGIFLQSLQYRVAQKLQSFSKL